MPLQLSFRSLDSLTTFINHSSELAMWHVVAKEVGAGWLMLISWHGWIPRAAHSPACCTNKRCARPSHPGPQARHLLRPGIDTLLQHRVRLLSAELAALAACLADVPRPPAYGSSGRWGFSDKPLYYDAVERSGTAVHGALLACDDGSVVPK